ncbi:MAG: osmotically inducible protein OsmC [Chloroflexi bacterium AL-W]|nr:osmotically inducible protein OsmC [Chloroflexi bacterium AL-N1]NOK69923.1 osmotically inducible protein OsmC [Chloroflexi bacterium AL-N10]NOK73781.1 osmotically inducible protein OsmC [Chloroflexi bacterium AL-N5]NOK85455.1 osmotically inducible protein OsmC [Chloroflexi bacterium AL-W]NOK91656.1 osmotically inducible protein OsmC [Chloroflexi bacterium AL-N15]
MDIQITFPGGARVDAQIGSHVVATDQPVNGGGADSAASPFDVFLAALGTCTGIYALNFCRQRNISTEGLRMTQHMDTDSETGMVRAITLEIHLPADFPVKYTAALLRAVEQCKVKKHLEHPPQVAVTTSTIDTVVT